MRTSLDSRAVLLIGVIAVLIAVSSIMLRTAAANPPSIIEKKSAVATTTLSYMTAGTATTTQYADLQSDNAPADSATLLIAYTASSSASTLKWRYEYSQGVSGTDCTVTATLCDWYSESINNAANTATTSVEVRDFKEYSWVFASSTPGGATTAGNVGYKSIVLPTPTRYVRAVFYLGAGSGNGAVWTDIVYKRQNR